MPYTKYTTLVTYLAIATLSGCCSLKPKVISLPAIPSYLSDNSTYSKLRGHYYEPLPITLNACQDELKLSRVDVVNCVIGHRNNNAEMQAIRDLNNYNKGK